MLLPLPGQGHINPMLQVAKLLHSRGFYVTFVHTRSSHRSILRSGGPDALAVGLEGFVYEVIPDGVAVPPTSSRSSKQQVSKGCVAYAASCSAPLREILAPRGGGGGGPPRVTCVVYNWLMSFALDVAEELRIPALAFCTMSACGFLGSYYLEELIHKGYAPLQDEEYLTNGYLDTTVDWIPGMRGIRLRDLSSFIRTTDADDFFLKVEATCAKKCDRAQGLILNTFDRLEAEVTEAIGAIFPNAYTLGPLPALLANHAASSPSMSMRFNYWKQEHGCTEWLDAQIPGSVIYVSFGSLTTLTAELLAEFAWGLVDSSHPFLWVVRPDVVAGGGKCTAVRGLGQGNRRRRREELRSWLVHAGGGAVPSFGRRLLDPRRLELDAGGRLRRRSGDLLAGVRGAAHELPVRLRGMGRRYGARQGSEEGGCQ